MILDNISKLLYATEKLCSKTSDSIFDAEQSKHKLHDKSIEASQSYNEHQASALHVNHGRLECGSHRVL
ncbi:hypothetical protein KSF78_0008338 [Schistosoma japonicum]|nr:hypothetical protein KSF78_0008338 [Schistosoma japonicum]